MPFITFIYKVGKNPKTYYGKYCTDYISDDHEGLDEEIKYILQKGILEYKRQKNPNISKLNTKITIGVLSLSIYHTIPTFSTEKEIPCFDFYYDDKRKLYINGKMINY